MTTTNSTILNTTKPDQRVGISAKTVCAMFDVSLRSWLRWDAAGKVPKGNKIGAAKRWDNLEINCWWNDGCKSRSEWEKVKKAVMKGQS
ncbi:MAG: hypothetical protein IH984_12130 [Planctomycetes bacterium]|nr:hypothetical protein [Planctomycetota bacterium]